MSNKSIGIVGMILGAVLVVSNVLVGFFGWWWLYSQLGYPSPGFGWRKITLIIVGALMLIVGVILYLDGKRNKK